MSNTTVPKGFAPPSADDLVQSPTTDRRRAAALLIFPLQIFLAAGWLRASVEKIIDPEWWSGEQLRWFLLENRTHMLPFFRELVDTVIEPLSIPIAVGVLAMQLACGTCLITNRLVKPALWGGIVLNVTFTMAGTVNPSAFYLVMQLAMLFVLASPTSKQIAIRCASLWLVAAAAMLPFARSIHPSVVIDDPALMLSFMAILASITTLVANNVAISEFVPPRVLDRLARSRVCRTVLRFDRRNSARVQPPVAPTTQR